MKKMLLIVCLLAACRTPAAVPDTRPPPEDAPALPTEWLVWASAGDSTSTYRIAASGEIVGRAQGAWIGAADGKQLVWQFDREARDVTQSDCDCEMEAMDAGVEPECDRPGTVEVGVLRPFPNGATIGVPPDDTIDTATQELFPTLDGSVGPYAFTTVCADRYVCGAAHGDTLCAQRIFDLRTATEVDEYDMTANPLRGPEMLEFVREAFDDEHEAAELAEEDVLLSWLAPRYEGGAVPRMEEQYTGPTCYACSDGHWDSYTISSRRTVDDLAPTITRWLDKAPTPPPAVFEQIEGTVGGWSLVPPDQALRKHLDEVFDQS